ncbi:MAG: hypothetical protein PVJ30_03370 [Thiohalocapsa sp.]|jgi:hypothetical protein
MTETILGGLLGVVAALVLIAILTIIFRWLWNITMPDVFGLKTLTFWQAIRVLILAGILFGGHRVIYTDPASYLDAADQAPTTDEAQSDGAGD